MYLRWVRIAGLAACFAFGIISTQCRLAFCTFNPGSIACLGEWDGEEGCGNDCNTE